MSLPAMSLGLNYALRSCVSRKGETGGGGWVHSRVQTAWPRLVLRSYLVGTGRAIPDPFGINGVRNKRSHLVRPTFPEFKASFSATAGWHSRETYLGWWVWSQHVSVKYGWNYFWEQFSLGPRPSHPLLKQNNGKTRGGGGSGQVGAEYHHGMLHAVAGYE